MGKFSQCFFLNGRKGMLCYVNIHKLSSIQIIYYSLPPTCFFNVSTFFEANQIQLRNKSNSHMKRNKEQSIAYFSRIWRLKRKGKLAGDVCMLQRIFTRASENAFTCKCDGMQGKYVSSGSRVNYRLAPNQWPGNHRHINLVVCPTKFYNCLK